MENYVKKKFCDKCHRKFRIHFPGVIVYLKSMMNQVLNKFLTAGLLFFHQHGVTTHTVCNSVAVLWIVFGDRIISVACLSNLMSCDYFLWVILKYNIYKRHPHTHAHEVCLPKML